MKLAMVRVFDQLLPLAVFAVVLAVAPAQADEPAIADLAKPNLAASNSAKAEAAKSDAAKSDAAAPTGPLLGKTVVEHVKIGVVITADTGPCRGIVATAP
ncbi:MAG TPA: hypothetical protein VHX65_18770, partial [Pirellulales bacterium]|nr:hypothetical protein [Pirellulales bacterium]